VQWTFCPLEPGESIVCHRTLLVPILVAAATVCVIAPRIVSAADPAADSTLGTQVEREEDDVGVVTIGRSAGSPGHDLWPDREAPSHELLTREEVEKIVRSEIQAERKRADEKKEEEKREKEAEAARKSRAGRPELTSTWNNGFVAESADKQFRFHLGGRLDWDNAWYQQDDNLLMGGNPPSRLEDGTAMRRARLRADGTVYGWIDFVTEVNFANIQDVSNVNDNTVQVGSVGLADFHLTFRELPIVGNLRAGHFVAPYSLERFTSANIDYYMERSPIFDAFFGPNQRQSGLMLFDSYFDDRVTLASSFTRVGKSRLNSFAFNAEDGLYAGGIRMTALPIYADEGRFLLHLGGNYFRQSLEDNQFSVANRFLLRAGGGSQQVPNILATGTFFSPDDAQVVDMEVAAVCGPFSLSGEYACAWGTNVFDRFDGTNFSGPRGDVAYHAAYVEGGLFVTRGDHRRYDKKTGTWSRTIPRSSIRFTRTCDGEGRRTGCGAVQLVARWSCLDLVSGSPTLTPTAGGARAGMENDVTLGVNWYLNQQTVVSVNYVTTHINSVVSGASGNIQGIGTRLHFDF
jgi:phosphate-selective porin OprO/OprP